MQIIDIAKSIRRIALENPDRTYKRPVAPDGRPLQGAECRYVHSTESMFVVNLAKSYSDMWLEPTFVNRKLHEADPDTLEGGCIVGLGLEDNEVDLTDVIVYEGSPGGHVARMFSESRINSHTEAIQFWIDRVQNQQDSGMRYEDCIEWADKLYNESSWADEITLAW